MNDIMNRLAALSEILSESDEQDEATEFDFDGEMLEESRPASAIDWLDTIKQIYQRARRLQDWAPKQPASDFAKRDTSILKRLYDVKYELRNISLELSARRL